MYATTLELWDISRESLEAALTYLSSLRGREDKWNYGIKVLRNEDHEFLPREMDVWVSRVFESPEVIEWAYATADTKGLLSLIKTSTFSDHTCRILLKNESLSSEIVTEILMNGVMVNFQYQDFLDAVPDNLIEDTLLQALYRQSFRYDSMDNKRRGRRQPRIPVEAILRRLRRLHSVPDEIPDSYLVNLYLKEF